VSTLHHARPIAEPASWAQARPFRACELCDHGQTVLQGQRRCTHPSAAGTSQGVPVHQARALGGACGPEADLMLPPWVRS